MLFPQIHQQIDWSKGYELLDKEFQQIVREAEVGRRYVDQLVKVWLNDGTECWVLVHVEVQSARESDFPRRMYVYNYRIYDRYDKAVASLAVLADDDASWQPKRFDNELFGCKTGFEFPTVKLLGLDQAALEQSNNPFAPVVLAHLKAQQTRGNVNERYAWKLRLVRGLYERGFSAVDVRELFRVIDWFMALPNPLELNVLQEIDEIQKEKQMPHMTSIERISLDRGLRRGIATVLEMKFGPEGLDLMPDMEQVHETERLESILDFLKTATSIDDVRPLCRPSTF